MISPPTRAQDRGEHRRHEMTLITRPIRRGPATSAMIIWAIGRIIPPPTPWRTRKIDELGPTSPGRRASSPSVNARPSQVHAFGAEAPAVKPATGITAASASR